MAKKKKEEIEEDEGLDDFEGEEFEAAYPSLGGKPGEKEGGAELSDEEMEEFPEEEEILGDEFGEEIEEIDYTYLSLELNPGEKEYDYELIVKGQSHGFCNIFVKHLLEMEGVEAAAYKSTSLEPAKIFIRLQEGSKIKEVLLKGMDALKERVLEVEKLFAKLI